jgi:ABC-2 type transport system permease protein
MLRRILALIRKELPAIWGDPRSRVVVIVPPVLQLFVFSFAATLEVRNIDVAVLDNDGGRRAREVVSRLEGSPIFRRVVRVPTPDALRQAIDTQLVLLAVRLPDGFCAAVDAGLPATSRPCLTGGA